MAALIIKAGKPTPELLAYQYLQTLPQMAQGDANKVWLVPSDFGDALKGFASTLGNKGDDGVFRFEPSKTDDNDAAKPEDDSDDVADWFDMKTDPAIEQAVRAAEAVARTPVESAIEPPRREHRPLSGQWTEPGELSAPEQQPPTE